MTWIVAGTILRLYSKANPARQQMSPQMASLESALIPILAKYRGDPTALLQILREAQEALDWISPETEILVASALQIPLTQVKSVTQFYAHLYDHNRGKYRILFSDNITDRMAGSVALFERMQAHFGVEPGQTSADGLVSIDLTPCTGLCDHGAAMLVNSIAIGRLDAERIDEIAALVKARKPLAKWPAELFAIDDNIHREVTLTGIPYVPGSGLDAAIRLGRAGMFDEIKRAALRGRGGAGFPTATKIEGARNAPGVQKYIVCNADEGEPGTFKDRVLLTSFSTRVLEGMAIAAYAAGAAKGFIYLRSEYQYLRAKLQREIEEMRASGRLGVSIRGAPGFDFDVEIHMGAGAYICGEGTAQIESLEGKPGRPRVKPPSMVIRGYKGMPTIVDNVETLAHLTEIALEGGASFARRGTRASTGTKLLSVSGDCERPGVYEYEFGVTIGRVLHDCGAVAPIAVQVGGASGVLITPDEFSRKIAFEDVSTAGAFMIFGPDRDIFEVARNFAHFFAHESCGFCTPCRVGTTVQKNLMDKIAEGRGSRYEVNDLMRLTDFMRRTSHCGLGESAGNAVRDTWLKFRPAFERRLVPHDFAPQVDLDAALEPTRLATHRDDAAAHIPAEG
ncbi:NAD(P)H-dependent oxidoreductase subunit E [uncultured Rhodoblastus sp.]|uniref:NAD(P)H-dependent oxidoreductase subunit E n=1 Tax=uncultured Rhodoblastus sp. TaxID=543037 RepID=UPI0025DD8033|nr:NAD(P)H-dependent oxidoreductase subunit E [uncultured Rhodoblastus sp.]